MLSLATLPNLPASTNLERGKPDAKPLGGNPFADLMRECSAELASDSKRVDTLPADTVPDEDHDTDIEGAEETDTPLPSTATLIPVIPVTAQPIQIAIRTAVDVSAAAVSENVDLAVPPTSVALSATSTVPEAGLSLLNASAAMRQDVNAAASSPLTPQAQSRGSTDENATSADAFAATSLTIGDGQAPIPTRSGMSSDVNAHTPPPPLPAAAGKLPASWLPSALSNEDPFETGGRRGSTEAGDLMDEPSSDVSKSSEGSKLSPADSSALEKPVATELQTEPTTTPAREPQAVNAVSHAPDSRVSMASIPHTIVRMASDPEQKTQTVKIRLDPPRLGEISVDLKLGENGLSVRVVSQTPEARDLLQQDLPRLQEVLKASGLNLQLFSASCDLAGERSERQQPALLERPTRSTSSSFETADTPIIPARRQYETSLRINAHA